MRIAIAGKAYFLEDNGQAAFTVRLARGLGEAGPAELQSIATLEAIADHLAWYQSHLQQPITGRHDSPARN